MPSSGLRNKNVKNKRHCVVVNFFRNNILSQIKEVRKLNKTKPNLKLKACPEGKNRWVR